MMFLYWKTADYFAIRGISPLQKIDVGVASTLQRSGPPGGVSSAKPDIWWLPFYIVFPFLDLLWVYFGGKNTVFTRAWLSGMALRVFCVVAAVRPCPIQYYLCRLVFTHLYIYADFLLIFSWKKMTLSDFSWKMMNRAGLFATPPSTSAGIRTPLRCVHSRRSLSCNILEIELLCRGLVVWTCGSGCAIRTQTARGMRPPSPQC